MNYHIGLIIGSLRRESLNRKLADAIVKMAHKDLVFREIAIGDLPLYDQDDDASPHETVRRLKAEVTQADGILFVTPEYNRSIPGVLKNALDHGSRPYGQSVWTGKPAGIIGISVGQIGTAVAQQHLRGILGYLDMPTLGQPEVFLRVTDRTFGPDGSIADPELRKLLGTWMERFVSWIRHHAPVQERPARQYARAGA